MAWTQSGNIRGASGVPGASGAPGATGPAGPTGASGASGGTGGTGGPGTTTWAGIVDKPGSILVYKGLWNVSTNSPSLSDASGSGGDVYRVSTGGTRNLGSGNISWEVGDYAIYSPTNNAWEKADTTDAVSSVAGRTGAVTLTSADLGASGSASSSTFLRGDNTWATPSSGISRSISTITTPTTLGSAASTDYVTFCAKGTGGTTSVSVIHFDGANNSTTIIDTGDNPSTWTANGDAKLSTTEKKFGAASLRLDGNGDTISAGTSSTYAWGSGNFTIEMFVRLDNTTGTKAIYDGRPVGVTNGAYPVIFINGSALAYFVSGGDRITGGTLSVNTWHHVALSRSGTNTRMFVDGTQIGSTWTDSTTYLNGTNRPLIGGSTENTQYFAGYIDEVALTPSAKYTANFTAPAAAFADAEFGIPTLPSAVTNTNLYTIKNISGSLLTVAVTSSQVIDGASGGLALANNTTARLVSDGSNWRTV